MRIPKQTAIIDLKTGRISGCKKGSEIWWHEKGHLVYNKTYEGMKGSLYQDLFPKFAITFICLAMCFDIADFLILKTSSLFIAISFIASWIYFYLREEAWCWKYADKHQ